MTNALSVRKPLTLPCGAIVANRFAKAAMTEGLAEAAGVPGAALNRLYERWSHGGAGILLTGNIMVDGDHLQRVGNVVVQDCPSLSLAALSHWAAAGKVNGNHMWGQINHPGRQSPVEINPEPVAPSAVQLVLPGRDAAMPRALKDSEIHDIIARFVFASVTLKKAGFTGVQVHAAHGYLISQFLSPLTNLRSDQWGGSLENRARLLLLIVTKIRAAVGDKFPVSVKLNSSDFQKGGFSEEECKQVIAWLNDTKIDLLEISGGTYEAPAALGPKVSEATNAKLKESTQIREGYFQSFAQFVRAECTIPLMVTGGFRTLGGIASALKGDTVDMIGLGRPLCARPDLPLDFIKGACEFVEKYEDQIEPPEAALNWFHTQITRLSEGLEPDLKLEGAAAVAYIKQRDNMLTAKTIG
jgi:2,4-dienoyl-CoA reductase-like NADH-dependent reductase (Old Yellow Enzyme family)